MHMPHLILVSIKGDPVDANAPTHICFHQRRSSGCTYPTSYLFLSKEIQWMHTCPNSFVSIKGDPVGAHAPPHISFYKRRSSGCTHAPPHISFHQRRSSGRTCPTSYLFPWRRTSVQIQMRQLIMSHLIRIYTVFHSILHVSLTSHQWRSKCTVSFFLIPSSFSSIVGCAL